MKKLFIVVMIFCAVFVSRDTEKYTTIMHEQIDTFVPEDFQASFFVFWQEAQKQYELLTKHADTLRADIKDWSIDSSVSLLQEIAPEEFILENKSFSPILDNSNIVFSESSSLVQKVYGSVLFAISFLFWNFGIFAVWVFLLTYLGIKKIKEYFFPKRRQSFFDRINEGVKKEMDTDWE